MCGEKVRKTAAKHLPFESRFQSESCVIMAGVRAGEGFRPTEFTIEID